MFHTLSFFTGGVVSLPPATFRIKYASSQLYSKNQKHKPLYCCSHLTSFMCDFIYSVITAVICNVVMTTIYAEWVLFALEQQPPDTKMRQSGPSRVGTMQWKSSNRTTSSWCTLLDVDFVGISSLLLWYMMIFFSYLLTLKKKVSQPKRWLKFKLRRIISLC